MTPGSYRDERGGPAETRHKRRARSHSIRVCPPSCNFSWDESTHRFAQQEATRSFAILATQARRHIFFRFVVLEDGVLLMVQSFGPGSMGECGRTENYKATSYSRIFRIYSSQPFTLAEAGPPELEARGKAIPEERWITPGGRGPLYKWCRT
jgi:hypothetical protein